MDDDCSRQIEEGLTRVNEGLTRTREGIALATTGLQRTVNALAAIAATATDEPKSLREAIQRLEARLMELAMEVRKPRNGSPE
jgi:ubiquinone biosynthesis protein UbiJ